MTITIFGSINIDITTYTKRLPVASETIHGQSYSIGLGGKGCNQAVAVSKLGAATHFIGRIGEDNFGDIALKELQKLGIATKNLTIDSKSNTGVAIIGVDAHAENCITVIGGANMAIDDIDVRRAHTIFTSTDILLLQMEIPLKAALSAADIVRKNGGSVILDPAPAPKNGFNPSIFSQIDIITPNETETEILTGLRPTNTEQAAQAALQLRNKGAATVAIKLGADGVYYQTKDSEGYIPSFTVESIDSVAAGDCFNGGLAYALTNGQALDEAVRFAAACGALATTKQGASQSAPDLATVNALLNG